MKNSISILAAAATCVAATTTGCGAGIPSSYKNKTTEVVLGSGRIIYYHLPASYDGSKPADVYFSFHGGTKTPKEQEQLSGLSDPFFNPHGIAVYPKGDLADDGKLYWLPNPKISEKSPNDLDFTLEAIEWLDNNLCTDQKYATGKSDGGGLVNLLACDPRTNAHFAAFASVSGAYYEDKLALDCKPGRPIPMVSFHGLNDDVIPFDGKNADDSSAPQKDKTFPVEDWLHQWVVRNGITSDPVNTTGEYSGLVKESAWSLSGLTNVTTFYEEKDLGHVWPSTLPNDDCETKEAKTCPLGHYTFNATTVIVEYLQKWQLPKDGKSIKEKCA